MGVCVRPSNRTQRLKRKDLNQKQHCTEKTETSDFVVEENTLQEKLLGKVFWR